MPERILLVKELWVLLYGEKHLAAVLCVKHAVVLQLCIQVQRGLFLALRVGYGQEAAISQRLVAV